MRITISLRRIRITISSMKKAAPTPTGSGKPVKAKN